jgi:hypothetical protein
MGFVFRPWLVFVFPASSTTQRKDGGVERVSPSPSEGRIVEWYDRLPLLYLAPHDPLLTRRMGMADMPGLLTIYTT